MRFPAGICNGGLADRFTCGTPAPWSDRGCVTGLPQRRCSDARPGNLIANYRLREWQPGGTRGTVAVARPHPHARLPPGMKWILAAFLFSIAPLLAQLPVPISPDWLKGGEKISGVLHTTEVQLLGNNYRVLQTNVTARSGGFRLLGFITIRSPSYVTAMSRLYARAGVAEGRPQALANVVHETGGLNLIVFSLPKIRVRADLIEFTGEPPSDAVRRGLVDREETDPSDATRTREREPAHPAEGERHEHESSDATRQSLRRALDEQPQAR